MLSIWVVVKLWSPLWVLVSRDPKGDLIILTTTHMGLPAMRSARLSIWNFSHDSKRWLFGLEATQGLQQQEAGEPWAFAS